MSPSRSRLTTAHRRRWCHTSAPALPCKSSGRDQVCAASSYTGMQRRANWMRLHDATLASFCLLPADARAQAVVVRPADDTSFLLPFLSRNAVPHITLSIAASATPLDSNSMLERYWSPLSPSCQLAVTGRLAAKVALEDGLTRTVYSLPSTAAATAATPSAGAGYSTTARCASAAITTLQVCVGYRWLAGCLSPVVRSSFFSSAVS